MAYMVSQMKYLGDKIDEKMNWKNEAYVIVKKLHRVNTLLYTIRNYVNFNTLKAIYIAVFDSHENYANLICNLIWGQNRIPS